MRIICPAITTDATMDSNVQDLSFSIVWSPLPFVTWLLPFIGHLGICDSQGIASDFRGSYYVGSDGRMAFGAPTRALKVDVGEIGAEQWDAAIRQANSTYNQRIHNICCDNCHSHVACALNDMHVRAFGIEKWSMINLCFLMFFRSRFLYQWAILSQFGPLLLLILIITLVKTL
ncbi:hypothetical protein MPSEU_000030200 [Mayamaea pseudoterrestris]|nr:hypothetical protein MPSEU_000030200 [Mayamaea pseudoterrestris]